MYQQIFEALKAKFVGVSDAILSRIATKLAKTATTAEQVNTAVDGTTIQQVIESYGDSRATEAQHTAVQNYEQKYGLKDGAKVGSSQGGEQQQQQQVQQPTIQTGGAQQQEQIPAWAQALLDSNKKLSETVTQMQTERTTATRKQQLTGIVAKLPENLRKPYEHIALDGLTDEQFSALVADTTKEVDDISAALTQRGVVFGKPSAQGGTQKPNELTEEQQKAIAHRDGVANKDSQPF